MRQIKEAIAWKVRKDVRINIVGKSHTNRKNTGEHEGVENMSDNRQNNRQSQRDADGFRYEEDPFYNLEKVASDMDCTGLVPSAVENEAESESYGELYAIHPPKAPEDGEEQRSEETSIKKQWAVQTKDAAWQERQEK